MVTAGGGASGSSLTSMDVAWKKRGEGCLDCKSASNYCNTNTSPSLRVSQTVMGQVVKCLYVKCLLILKRDLLLILYVKSNA